MENLEKLKFLYDIEVELSAFIGKIDSNIEFILKLEEGDLIEIDKNIDDYLEIYVGNLIFGKGELVIVNDKFSVRLIDMVK